MSQRSGPGSGRGDEGPQRVAGGSQRSRASGQPPSSAGSQRGVQGPPPIGEVEGPLYRHPENPKLNDEVLRLEKEYSKIPSLSSLSLTQERFPNRPGFGTRGKQRSIWANYFALLVDPRLVLHQYNIEVQPQATGRKLFRIIELFLQQPESKARSDSICSDFQSNFFSRVLLDNDFTARNVVYRSELETEPGQRATVYHIRLRYIKTLPVRRLLEFITSTTMPAPLDEKNALIQAFNVFLNHYAKSQDNLVTIGSKTFPKNTVGRDLGGGLTAIRGFFSSVRAATGRILVNVNVCYSAFYQPGPLVRLMTAQGSSDRYRLEQFLKGARVKVTHTRTPRIRTISALASLSDGQGSNQPRPRVAEFGAGPHQVQFWLNDHQRHVSVSEFFYTTYDIRIDNEKLPVVNVGSKANPIYLPPQVCEVMPGQRAGVKLTADQTSKMINYAIRRPAPAQNALSIAQEGLPMVGMSQQKNHLLDQFHVKVNPNFTSVPARILDKPGVGYGNKRSARVDPSAAWSLRGFTMSRPATIPAGKWGWLYITMIGCLGAFKDQGPFKSALESFQASLQKQGIKIGQPSQGSRTLRLNNEEDPVLETVLKGAAEKGLELMFIIMPAKNMALFSRIKYLCDVKLGVANICCIGKNLVESPGRPQYFGNVGLKLNLKSRGDNHLVNPSNLHWASREDTMILGVDVTHPSPTSSKQAPSIVAMTAKVQPGRGQYVAITRVQTGRQEMVEAIGDMLKEGLDLWENVGKHPKLPRSILLYRDGVSESQYNMVKDFELCRLKMACEETYDRQGQERPRITIVIVTKRHHTRFGPITKETADDNGNCLAGTITDRGITETHQWDFWLQAHSALQGAARPAHYFVVHDEIFRATRPAPGYTVADTLEDITQSLHYDFGRCSRAVSYCAPAYYADLACERGRCYLNPVFDPSSHSDTASMISGLDQEDENRRRSQLQELITPHPRVRDTMYFI